MNNCQQDIEVAIQQVLSYFQSGALGQAQESAQAALAKYPESADLHHVMSKIFVHTGEMERAREFMVRATKLPDANPSFLLDLAEIHDTLDDFDGAVDACTTYLAKTSNAALGLKALALLYENKGDFPAAERLLHQAVEASRGDAESEVARLNELAIALHRMGKTHEAIAIFREALALDPSRPELHLNIANSLMNISAPDEAIKHYQRSLDVNYENPHAHLPLGFAFLLKGKLKRGWREMEWLWKIPVFESTALDTPRWTGEQIDGTVLLLAEQGLGDSVHFIRYAKLVAERCKRVIAYVPQKLVRLTSTAPCLDEAFGWDTPVPEHDAYIPMMSLPGVFNTELDNIPADVPYLSAEPNDIKAWKGIIKEYWHAKGWDEHGIPTEAKVKELGL